MKTYKQNNMLYVNINDLTELTHTEHNAHVTKHYKEYQYLKDLYILNDDILSKHDLLRLHCNNFTFWIEVLNESPYFHKGCILINITLSCLNRSISFYIDKTDFNDFINSLSLQTEAV